MIPKGSRKSSFRIFIQELTSVRAKQPLFSSSFITPSQTIELLPSECSFFTIVSLKQGDLTEFEMILFRRKTDSITGRLSGLATIDCSRSGLIKIMLNCFNISRYDLFRFSRRSRSSCFARVSDNTKVLSIKTAHRDHKLSVI